MDSRLRKQRALAQLEETRAKIAARLQASQSTSQGTEPRRPALNVRNAVETKPRPSGLFSKPYIDYDLSKMKDSRGGFIDSAEPEQQTVWMEKQTLSAAPFPLDHPEAPGCFECGSKDLEFILYNVFGCRVCRACRAKLPEKYSLLTKTECKSDYLLTEPELKDPELLAHLERPNPYKQTYSNMMLYLRYQVEEYAFRKWSGAAGLDAEYERRVAFKKERKQARFEERLRQMRNKTRAQTITRTTRERHVHAFGAPQALADGTVERRCACGMKTNELVF